MSDDMPPDDDVKNEADVVVDESTDSDDPENSTEKDAGAAQNTADSGELGGLNELAGNNGSSGEAKGDRGDSERVREHGDDDVNDVNMEVILDVPVTLGMEVGRTRMNIRNLLQLNQGSVVELDRAAGEPLDVFVNGTLIAHGEVVVINERFGIRLTDVISPAERVRNLK